ncbi:hypothetical protein GR254_25120, partial [Mycobacterium tuberculosis]|nr:hypothetical protein [Mycobacterium tuberculosis]
MVGDDVPTALLDFAREMNAPPATWPSLATSLGATMHTVVGDDVPTALLDFAREMNAPPATWPS